MTTPPYEEPGSLSTTPFEPQHTSTPIGDALADDTGLDAPMTSADESGGAAASAKETAKDALGSASEHGSAVADTAKDEATKVVGEAKDKATDLLADVKSQADEQSKAQLQNLASKIGELADELEGLVTNSDTNGTVTSAAQQLAGKTRQLSQHLEGRQPLDLLEDARGFARRRPGAFLAGAAAAGLLAGRLTRGAKASQDSDDSAPAATASSPTATTPSPTVTPGDTPFVGSPPATGAAFGEVDDIPTGQNTGGRQ